MDVLSEAEANYLRAKLQAFLSRNPESDVRTEGREPSVSRPWGEEAIEIPLRSDDEELFEALNAVRLPPRFTAIWHEDTREFEVIFTVLNKGNHLLERSFEFRYRGSSYHCDFRASSARLRLIAHKARRVRVPYRSDFRNLQPFYQFEHMLLEHPEADFVRNGRPTSFYIHGFEDYNDERIGELVRNLNFHMSYFDGHTPTILIHEESVVSHSIPDHHWSGIDTFPDSLSGKEIEQHLLILWASAQEGDPFLRFIQYYQILEYAGFYYVKDIVKRQIERAIAAPDAASNSDKVAQRILEAFAAGKMDDKSKINAVIRESVDPQEMWNLLKDSLNDFTEDVELEGGFVLPALLSASTGYEDFVQN